MRHYYPNVARSALLARGYIGRASTHAKGISVDLTIVRRAVAGAKGPGKADIPQSVDGSEPMGKSMAQAPGEVACTKISDQVFDGRSLDMGTTFDCFDPKSHTGAGGLTSEQREARQLLKRVMERHGFQNFAKEWWHYTYGAADDGRTFDVPVRAAGATD